MEQFPKIRMLARLVCLVSSLFFANGKNPRSQVLKTFMLAIYLLFHMNFVVPMDHPSPNSHLLFPPLLWTFCPGFIPSSLNKNLPIARPQHTKGRRTTMMLSPMDLDTAHQVLQNYLHSHYHNIIFRDNYMYISINPNLCSSLTSYLQRL